MLTSTETLIGFVKMHPSIWDKGCEEYKDRYMKEKAWIDIAEMSFPDWDSFGKKMRNAKVDALKKKWKNIKDTLKRNLHAKSGDAAKKKKYVHLESLSFLHNTTKKKRTSNLEEEDPNKSDNTHDESSPLPPSENPLNQLGYAFKKPSGPNKMTPFQESFAPQARSDEDADRFYLLSLLPDYKALPPGQKWAFRQHVGNFFRQNYIPSTSTPPHNSSTNFTNFFQEHSSEPCSDQLHQTPQPLQTYQMLSCKTEEFELSPSLSSQS